MKDYILCCDWGTSTFRLRLVIRTEQQIIKEVVSQQGTASTFNAWKKKENAGLDRKAFFLQYLKEQIDLLRAQVNFSLDHVPVIISGMASSSIGMQELPYVTLPFAVDGSQAGIFLSEPQSDFPHQVILVSGVKSEQDVMRGEETQLIGLIDLLNLSGQNLTQAIFIMPGTHSKHVYVADQRVINFQTFMTGEVFDLMAKQSILKDSIRYDGLVSLSDANHEGFKRGIIESGVSHVLHGLFTVRTNHLFNILNKEQNFYYLSGLLIGTELRTLLPVQDQQIILCSGNNLFALYKLALEELGLLPSALTISPELSDKSTVAGQLKIFQYQQSSISGI